MDSVKSSPTWVSVLMLATVVASGFFGKYVAKSVTMRRNWRFFHIPYTVAFYVVVLPHVMKEGFKP
ncbi:MAG: hypothetical protein HY675_04520 [Chloroflexi bacterium]|nr:hypothetical protein [Chloroflexota bacterium]